MQPARRPGRRPILNPSRQVGAAWPPLFAAWAVALVSTLAALFIGEVMGQAPCTLCWFQRICMFPLAIVLGIACLRSDFCVWRYGLPLAVIGAVIAAVHSLQYAGWLPHALEPCGAGPPCSGADMTIAAMPIPWLALAAFATIAGLLLLLRRKVRP